MSALMLVVLILVGTPTATAATNALDPRSVPPSTDQPVPPETARPPITANDFIPEERDITDCIGVLERPGCGSESRGGWRQTAVLAAIVIGLVVVFGNIVRGVRRNRR